MYLEFIKIRSVAKKPRHFILYGLDYLTLLYI